MTTGFIVMARGTISRILAAAVLLTADAVAATTILTMAAAPSSAQLFDDRFPFQNRRQQRGPFDWFGPQPQYEERSAPPQDFSRAPAAKKADPKAETAVQTPIMVFGDAMADWLAYGLELAYSDTP